jgi:arsenate reductase
MGEGFTRVLKGDLIEVHSAGLEPKGVDPLATKVMSEVGIDIGSHRSKSVRDLLGREFDYVVTVCGHAHEFCPVFPGRAKVVHAGFEDPPALAKDARTEEEALAYYRRVRDQIRAFVEKMPAVLEELAAGFRPSPDIT